MAGISRGWVRGEEVLFQLGREAMRLWSNDFKGSTDWVGQEDLVGHDVCRDSMALKYVLGVHSSVIVLNGAWRERGDERKKRRKKKKKKKGKKGKKKRKKLKLS